MIILKVKDEMLAFCKELVKNHEFGMRGIADGTKEQQFVGLVGQCIILDLLNYPFPTGNEGFDNGIDLVLGKYKIDIKTMGRNTEVKKNYVCNFIGLQKKYDTDIYIFNSFNKISKMITICGWIDKDSFFKKAQFLKKGSVRYRADGSNFSTFADLYEIRIECLNDVNSVESLVNCIKIFSKT
jgi:hypothetical protein